MPVLTTERTLQALPIAPTTGAPPSTHAASPAGPAATHLDDAWTVEKDGTCPTCAGSGWVTMTRTCTSCRGTGVVNMSRPMRTHELRRVLRDLARLAGR